jgi:hypothetical protein
VAKRSANIEIVFFMMSKGLKRLKRFERVKRFKGRKVKRFGMSECPNV